MRRQTRGRFTPYDPAKAEAERDRAAAATHARMERDLERTDWRTGPLLELVREHLFTRRLKVEALLDACPGDRATVSIAFHTQFGDSIWDYATKARLETGARMLRDTGLRVGDVSNLLGYSDRMVFSDAFLRWTGMRPNEFRRRCRATAAGGRAGEELHSLALLEDLRQGRLESRRAARVLAALEAVAPAADPMAGQPALPPVRAERLAGWIWELVEGLPEARRRYWARHVIRVDSPTFFHLLGEKIREQVRRDPRVCLELAQLALEHLEANAPALGEEAPALRVLGRAWLGNAQRLAWDFAGAHQTFRRAREQWRAAGEDRRVEAELCDLEASLRIYQCRPGEALALLARSSSLAQVLGDSQVLVSSLLQRVAILSTRGDHRAAIADLRLALRELEALDDPALTLAALCNLTSAYVFAGRPRQALAVLPRALELCRTLDEPISRHQLRWTEGLARQALGEFERAEELLEEAQIGFLELDARGYAAVVALDRGILCLERGRDREVPRLAAATIPVFEDLGLGRETVAAVELLRRAILDDAVTLRILRRSRVRLLASLCKAASRPPEAGEPSGGTSANA